LFLAGCTDDSGTMTAGKPDLGTDGSIGADVLPSLVGQPTFCDITAKLKPSPGADGGGQGLPTSHRFSLLVDWAGNTAVTGAGGTASKVNLVQLDGEWTTQSALALSLSLAQDWTVGGINVVGRPFVSYERIAIHPTADGCAGSATGNYLGNNSDMLFTIPFEAELAGVIDQSAPGFSILPSPATTIHPLDLYGVASGELLPAGTSARWLSTGGITVPMSALPASGAQGVSGFLLTGFALAFASTYHLDLLPAAIDLAGNLAVQPPVVTTVAGPGFFAQDGFEGSVDALLGGQVKAVDATTLPIPAGAVAIRFAPTGFATSGEWSCNDRFTARLAVAPAAKVVKLSALAFRSSYTGPFMGWLRLAVPNGAVADFGSYWTLSNGTPLPSPWSGTLPRSAQNTYGQLTQFELALPAGTGREVIFDLYRPCTEPMLPSDGLVIDDLRVE
jgi:hypothetical protein